MPNPLLEYLPDIMVGIIIFGISMSGAAYRLGALPLLIWLGGSALLIVYRRNDAGAVIFRWWPLLLMPLMAFLSFAWSELPAVTTRYGLQLLMTAFLGVFIARVLPPHRFATSIFVGMLLFCVLSVLSNRQGYSAEGQVLIGLTGSKNAMGFAANLLFTSALVMLFMPKVSAPLRLAAPLGMAIGGYIVWVTDSATAVVLTVAAAGLLVAMNVFERVRPAGRISLMLFAILILAPLALAPKELSDAINTFARDVLGKDLTTLTGRTYLWEHADFLISQKPLLGHGFQAVWNSGSSEIIGILRWAQVTDARGINWHSTYREVGVDLGFIGIGLLVSALIASFVAGLRQFVFTPTPATSFTFVFLLVTLSKSWTELIIVPFGPPTVLLFACCAYAFWRPPSPEQAPRAPMRPPQRTRPMPPVRVT